MDSSNSTPPYHRSDPRNRTKSASRLARIRQFVEESEVTPNTSLELIPSSPQIVTLSPSNLSPKPQNSLPLHELLMLSPSPHRKSRTRLAERLDMAEESGEQNGARRRHRSRNSTMAMMGCGSPRNGRRSRKRIEQDSRDEKELGAADEILGKPRKRKNSVKSKKEKLSLIPSNAIPSPKTDLDEACNLDEMGKMINDLVMWKDTAKSSLWFGLGSLCFLSSCFTKGIHVSIFSVLSQLGLLLLGVSFFSNSLSQRNKNEGKREYKLKENDILRVARIILPPANLAISRTRDLFSGEPSTTLKVIPFLLVGAEYGHLITLWRLSALGFFISFTAPKLYSSHSTRITQKVEYLKLRALEGWSACAHKKIVAMSAATAFWNLTTIKTRIFAAFVSMVVLRYHRQNSDAKIEDIDAEAEQQQQQALVVRN